jgi:hypothetical protein
MPQINRLAHALPAIITWFEASPTKVFRQKDLSDLFHNKRLSWVPSGLGLMGFIAFLVARSELRCVKLQFSYRPETLYSWGRVSPYVLAVNAKPGAYISHGSALYLHGLTKSPQKVLYANQEQRPLKPATDPPTQQSIDIAFRRPQRLTTNVAKLGRRNLVMLNGKHTGRLGVIELRDDAGRPVPVTGLEQSLIDACVRPAYAGGPTAILNAFRKAAPWIAVGELAAMLKTLAYVYPYDQAIGFYLERTRYFDAAALAPFRERPFVLDFYLDYAMKDTEYCPTWRVHFPRELDIRRSTTGT